MNRRIALCFLWLAGTCNIVTCAAASPERQEAVIFCKVLVQHMQESSAPAEAKVVADTKKWLDEEVQFRSERQNAQIALELAAKAEGRIIFLEHQVFLLNNSPQQNAYSAQIHGQVFEAVNARRDVLVRLVSALIAAAVRLHQVDYGRASIPGEINQIKSIVVSYPGYRDLVTGGISNLRKKYKITDAELAQ